MQTFQLVEVFLPASYGDGEPVPQSVISLIRDELVEKFGGATIYSRAPMEGLWADGSSVVRDSIIVIEVMVEEVDKKWWKEFRQRIEALLRQEELLVRVTSASRL